MEAAVATHRPDLIVCPMLKKLIPESVWSAHRCLVVHPGPPGDRGPSSLDWAIELGAGEWGVTVLEADGHFDAGAVWASRTFPTRPAGKSSLYRHEVRRAAVEAIVEAVQRIAEPGAAGVRVAGEDRPLMTQDVRAIDWAGDPTDAVVRKLRAAEGHPGVLDCIGATEFHLFGVHRERELRGEPGEIVATRDGAICRATTDGAVWITHLKGARGLQAPRHARAGPRRHRGAGARGPGRRRRGAARRAHLPRDRLRGARGRRLPALRLLQRRDEHRAVPASARRLRARPHPARDEGHRAHGRSGLLLQRHPPQRHRGGRRPGGRVVAEPAGDRRRRARDRRDRLASRHLRPHRRRRRRRRALRARRRSRRGARGRRAQPLLPAHGRPLRLGVLDLPAPAPRRRRRRRAADERARSLRWARARRSSSACSTPPSAPPPTTSRASVRDLAERTRARPAHRRPARREAPPCARATSRSSRCARTATRSSPAPTAASSARTAATTRPATASCTSSARRAPCRPRLEDRRGAGARG